MATWFSDHYTETGVDQSSLPVLPATSAPDSSVDGGRLYIMRAFVSITTGTTGDELRLWTMRSSDRIHFFNVFCDGGFDNASTLDFGFYATGDNHDGAVVGDVDVLSKGIDITSAIDAWDASELFNDNSLDGTDRGKKVWELINVGAASTYAQEPNVALDVVALFTANVTTIGKLVIEVGYTPQGA